MTFCGVTFFANIVNTWQILPVDYFLMKFTDLPSTQMLQNLENTKSSGLTSEHYKTFSVRN